jgi:hypothetical protein
MPLQNREAKGYAVIIDMRGSARDKALHPIGSPAAEEATEPRPPPQGAKPGQHRLGTNHGGTLYPRFEQAKHHGPNALATT